SAWAGVTGRMSAPSTVTAPARASIAVTPARRMSVTIGCPLSSIPITVDGEVGAHVRPRTEITARRPGTDPTAGGASSITRRWTDRDLPSTVLTQAHRPLRLALVLLLAQGLPLVELLLAAHQRDLDLGPPL